MIVMVIHQGCCDTEITQKDCAIVINKKIGSFNVTMYKSVHMEIAMD